MNGLLEIPNVFLITGFLEHGPGLIFGFLSDTLVVNNLGVLAVDGSVSCSRMSEELYNGPDSKTDLLDGNSCICRRE